MVDGSYTIEFFDTINKSAGYYFLQGGFGVVYTKNSLGLLEPQIVRAINPAYWALETYVLLGVGLKSGFLNVDNCGELAESLFKQEEYEKAAYCYELKIDSHDLLGRRKGICDKYVAGYAAALVNTGKTPEARKLLLQWAKRLNKHTHIDNILSQI